MSHVTKCHTLFEGKSVIMIMNLPTMINIPPNVMSKIVVFNSIFILLRMKFEVVVVAAAVAVVFVVVVVAAAEKTAAGV